MITSNDVRKPFHRTTKPTLAKSFPLFYDVKQIDNILPLSAQLYIHGRRHNVLRTQRFIRTPL